MTPGSGDEHKAAKVFEMPLWPLDPRSYVPPGEPDGLADAYRNLVAFFETAPETWGFWHRWLEGMRKGQPMDWELQRRVALIGAEDDFKIWEGGPEVVAAKIREIEAAWMAKRLPQVETLVKSEVTGLYNVVASAVSSGDQLSSFVAQTRFALETATRGNSGLNPYCIGYRYIVHACEVCPEDANTVEQHFTLAANALEKGLKKGKYQEDEGIEELVESLRRHALQLRSDHPEVGKAYVTRVAQTFRELEDDSALKLAEATADYAETTEDRLETETRLDEQTLRSDEPPEVKAEAVKRVLGRASKQSLMERASEGVKAVDKSGGATTAKLTYTGYKILEVAARYLPF